MDINSSSMEQTPRSYVALKGISTKYKAIDNLVEKGKKTKEEAEEEKKKLFKRLSPEEKKWKFDLRLYLLLLLVFALAAAILRALPEGKGWLLWLFDIPPLPKEAVNAVNYATVLGPLMAVAIAIERLLETFFDTFEQASRSLADVLAAPEEILNWVGREFQEAYKAVQNAAGEAIGKPSSESLEKLKAAEKRLASAEERLRSWAYTPEYTAWKRALSICIGLLVGLLVAILGDLGMFHIIRIPVPRLLDMLVTGLVVGAGPGPMHSLIGILQSGKDAVNNLAELAKGRKVNEALVALKNSTSLPTP